MGLHLQPSVHHNKKEPTGNNAVQEPLSHLPGSHPQLGTLRQPDYQRESFLSSDQLRVSVQQSDVQGRWRSGAGELPHCGQQWCYVDPAYSSCQDLVPSQRFPNNPWSYEACATPPHTSPVCLGVPAPVLPVAPVAPAVPVVPVEPVHPPVHPTYPLPQPHPVAPSSVAGVGGQAQTIQEIFVANGGYDPETIGEPRHGDASSKS